MPFGLKNAPSVFQWLRNSMLADMTSIAAAYIDDIVIFSTNFEEHLSHLEAVFTRLEETGLTLKQPKKCNLKLPVSWTHGWSRRRLKYTHTIPQGEEEGYAIFPGSCKILQTLCTRIWFSSSTTDRGN